MGFLSDKRALITGVASNKSIAWGIAQAMHREGAKISLTYQNERLLGRVSKLASELNSDFIMECDLDNDAAIDAVADQISSPLGWG